MILRLIGVSALLAAALAAPAAAAELDPIKPCYVSDGDRRDQRESIVVHGTGFTPTSTLDLFLDDTLVATGQADANGEANALVPAPFHARGQRPFNLRVEELDNPANFVTVPSLVSNLTVTLKPNRARPSRRVRFRGRGFTDDAPIFGHYLYGGELVKTVRLARRPRGRCGLFKVRRRQIPVRRPRTGKWTLQVDQQREYSETPASHMQRIIITVRETFIDPD